MSLGDRIKGFYENVTKYVLPKRTYTIIRIDGKAFHTYTKGMDKPFDFGMIEDMSNATSFLCSEIPGAVLGYTQSDEISLLLTDFNKYDTEAWFGGNLQKVVSVSASLATTAFNDSRINRLWKSSGEFDLEKVLKSANFDARAFTMPSKSEVEGYFIWRQRDCIRNSVSMAARSMFSHNQLMNKKSSDMKDMMKAKGTNWDYFPNECKFGIVVYKEERTKDISFTLLDGTVKTKENVLCKEWVSKPAPMFTEDRQFLDLIPEMP